jgi:predicted esterase
MLALHADSGVIEEEIKFWKPMTDKGYILGMPRSTNVYWSGKDSSYWPDHETAAKQIKSYLEKIMHTYSINIDQTVIGGLSSGAELAIWLALSKTIPVRKFVAVSPGGQWMNEVERYQSLIDDLSQNELSGIVILGEEDKIASQENIRTLVKMLNNAGIPCQLYEPPKVGHWYSPDFSKRLSLFV